ncbi:type II toxin-antitoxin system VapC family toxin [Ollibium composti]|uniref:Type II toxin-antitoxin system VapC family toxin n=1 Tax=Ollibium composti TaxID=2675109 RepID=A0ABY2Q918_9HYPH|nr:type II toxin-antitoxin system VapC family toxin [Mesorhizobium composti]THF58192.1 type II toxin-antitoxin system VapC family toxin [Mesorhizobium composti]
MSPRIELYILDTNVVSELIKPRPNANVVNWMARQEESLAITVGCVTEIQRGISLLQRRNVARAVELQDWLNALVKSTMPTLPTDVDVAMLYGRMTAVPQLNDIWIHSPQAKTVKLRQDLEMAAFAIVHRATLVTMNTKDFLVINRYFRLPGLYDPARDQWSIRPIAGGRRPRNNVSRLPERKYPHHQTDAWQPFGRAA